MKVGIMIYRRINGEEEYIAVGEKVAQEYMQKQKSPAAPPARPFKKIPNISISHQKQKCEYCGRPLEAPIELESGKCLNCLDVLSYYRGE